MCARHRQFSVRLTIPAEGLSPRRPGRPRRRSWRPSWTTAPSRAGRRRLARQHRRETEWRTAAQRVSTRFRHRPRAASIEVLYAGLGLAGVGKLLDVPVLRTVVGLAGAAVMAYLGLRSVRAAFTEPSPASSPTAPPTSEQRPRADQTRLTRYHAPTR
ncbi:LysE family transporter [Streptomyces olivaceoviridis]